MATQNKTLKKAFLAAALLGSAAVLVYACGGDDSSPGPVVPMPDAGDTGGSAGDSTGTAGAAGDGAGGDDTAGSGGSGGAGGATGGSAGSGGGTSPDGGTCEPSGSFDNTRIKDLLLSDGGLKPL